MANTSKRKLRSRLTKSQQKPEDALRDRLAPLKLGATVTLQVELNRRHGKTQRKKLALMLIAPGRLYGLIPETVVITLVGMGGSIVFPKTGKGASELAKSGLPMPLVVALLEKLSELYGDRNA